MLINRRSLMICSIVPRYPLACKSPLHYVHCTRTHAHDEVVVIENPFSRNFDIVADSPSCLLFDMLAFETSRDFATRGIAALAEQNSDTPLLRKISCGVKRIASIKFD